MLETPIEYLRGVGPQRALLLKSELQVANFQDLLHLFPTRYIDKTQYYKIQDLRETTTEVQVVGRIIHLKTVEGKKQSSTALGGYLYRWDWQHGIGVVSSFSMAQGSLATKCSLCDFWQMYPLRWGILHGTS